MAIKMAECSLDLATMHAGADEPHHMVGDGTLTPAGNLRGELASWIGNVAKLAFRSVSRWREAGSAAVVGHITIRRRVDPHRPVNHAPRG
jgi:hypothetical protein